MKIEMTRAQLGEAATKWVVDRVRLADGDHELEVRIHEKGGGATVTIPDVAEFTVDEPLIKDFTPILEQLDELEDSP